MMLETIIIAVIAGLIGWFAPELFFGGVSDWSRGRR